MQKQKGIFTAGTGYVQMNVWQGGESRSVWVCPWSALQAEGKLADPAFPWGPVYPTGWYFSQLLGGDNVFHIWNSYHLCLASFAMLRVARGTILKLICWVFCLSVRNRRKQACIGPSIYQTHAAHLPELGRGGFAVNPSDPSVGGSKCWPGS